MNEGLLYQLDNNTANPLFVQARLAAVAYTRRTGQQPELCHATPAIAALVGMRVAGMEVVADAMIAPNCLWVGRRAATSVPDAAGERE